MMKTWEYKLQFRNLFKIYKNKYKVYLRMAPTNEEESEETLEAIFSRGLSIHTDIESSSEDTNSKDFQHKVRKAILLLEDATR